MFPKGKSATGTADVANRAKYGRRRVSRATIEVVLSRSVAFFGLAFGAQSLPIALSQQQYASVGWFAAAVVCMFGVLVFAVVAAITKRLVRTANVCVLSVFLGAVVTWPAGLRTEVWISADRPWLWNLVTVATAAAAIALPLWAATAYLVVTPVLCGVLRLVPSGGSVPVEVVMLDVAYALIVGGAVLVIITVLRIAAAAVDAAQTTAQARYAAAVKEHATEVERVQVDSIVHDSVLTTLLSAANARSPEAKALATTMATDAIGYLQTEAATRLAVADAVSCSSLQARIASAAATLSSTISVRDGAHFEQQIPAAAADALYAASLQAMVNSLQHAGNSSAVSHWVEVACTADGVVSIEVGDTGRGFLTGSIPVERLGVRVSIFERLANAGGDAEIDSAPGRGTTVRLRWPALVPKLNGAPFAGGGGVP